MKELTQQQLNEINYLKNIDKIKINNSKSKEKNEVKSKDIMQTKTSLWTIVWGVVIGMLIFTFINALINGFVIGFVNGFQNKPSEPRVVNTQEPRTEYPR